MWRIKQIASAVKDILSALDWLSTIISLVLGIGVCGTAAQAVTAYFGASPLEATAYGLATAHLLVWMIVLWYLVNLHTPSVSMDILKIEEDAMRDSQEMFLEVTGASASYIRPEVFVVVADPIGKGHTTLYRFTGSPISFGVHRGEKHALRAVVYNKKDISQPLKIELPCKIPVHDSVQGKEFFVRVHAYGGPKEAELEFNFGVDDQGTLWAQKVGSTKRIVSRLRELLEQAGQLIKK